MQLTINDKNFQVKIAKTEEELAKGLQGVKELAEDEGMLFVFDEPQTVQFWMKDTLIPLDICFINEDLQITSIYHGKPKDETKVEEDEVLYVLEISPNTGVKEGDEVVFEGEEKQPMKVLLPNGETQMEIQGGERIFSRVFTKRLIHWAKRAERSKSDSDYKHLGKMMFKELKAQDTREPEYVNLPD